LVADSGFLHWASAQRFGKLDTDHADALCAKYRCGLGSVASLKSMNGWPTLRAVAIGSRFTIAGNQPVALGGLFLTGRPDRQTQSPVPPLSFIGAGGNAFVQFHRRWQIRARARDHVKFNLKKSGEAVAIYSPVQLLIDAISFGQQQTGVSQGRFPDGSVNIVNFAQTVSPAESNFLPLPNVVVNEVLSHTDPPLEDAVEFYAPSGTT